MVIYRNLRLGRAEMSTVTNLKENCLTVIPALNESQTIGHVVKSVKRAGFRNVVVIDDASDDNTAELAEQAGATVISLLERLGAWGATQTGLRYAIRKGFSAVVTMDADDQHPAREINTLVSTLQSADTNVVIGSCSQRGSGLRQVA